MNSGPIAIGVPFIVLSCIVFSSADVHGGRIDKIVKDLDDIHKKSVSLPPLYLRTDKKYSDRYVSQRFVDGENLYRIKDYERAAIIFLDIIDNYPNYVAYPDALFLYADALFLSGNVLSSKHAFERFLAESHRQGAERFKERALERLLEIAVHTNSFEKTHRYLTLLRQYSTDAARYAEGKFFYFKKDFKRAEQSLRAVRKDNALKLKAQYLIGAIYTMDGRYADALSVFKYALSIAPANSKDFDILDLVNLGAGRLHYELGQFEEALKYYQRIKESSPYFDSSLYESASAMFQAGDAKRAEQTLEVLMISVPDSRYRLRAEMLRGRLLLQDNQFDEAEGLFNKTVRDFTPMISRLDSVIKEQEDPQLYFYELVKTNMSSLEISGVLPPLAVKWVEDEKDVQRALKTNSDFDDAKRDLRETTRLLHLIEAVVNGPSASHAIPLAAEGRRQSSLLMNRLAQVRFVLSETAEESARGESQEPSSLRARRIQLAEKIRGLPVKEEELDSREEESKQIFLRMNAELKRNAIRLDRSDAIITAIEKFVSDVRYLEGMPKETIETVKQELLRTRTSNTELRKELDELKNEVEEAKYRQGLGKVQDAADAIIRNELRTLSNQERSLFNKTNEKSIREIEGLFHRIDTIESFLFDFENKLQNESEETLSKIRSQIKDELENLNACEGDVARLNGEMREVVGGVTYDNLAFVRKRFRDLVVKADVGILDSAWLRKEAHTSKITNLNNDRSKEIQLLESDFQEMTSRKDKDSN